MRRKRVPNPPSSDKDVPIRRAKGRGVKKRSVAVEDKENEGPLGGEGKEWAVEVQGRFAEIDRWEMQFESVDLSFSSQ
jgi:hypothetical protein